MRQSSCFLRNSKKFDPCKDIVRCVSGKLAIYIVIDNKPILKFDLRKNDLKLKNLNNYADALAAKSPFACQLTQCVSNFFSSATENCCISNLALERNSIVRT